MARRGRKTNKNKLRGVKVHRDLDGPTPEAEAMRSFLALGGDVNLCSTPLGVWRARNVIPADWYDMGERYGSLFRAVFGRVHVGPSQGPVVRPEDAEEKHWRDLMAYDEVLLNAHCPGEHRGWVIRTAVNNLCVYQAWNRFTDDPFRDVIEMMTGHNRTQYDRDKRPGWGERDVKQVRRYVPAFAGLRELARWYARGDKRKEAA